MKASTDTFKITESIGDRVGGYNFLPALIAFSPRRKQCPLYSVNSESSLLDCAGSEGYSKDWSPSSVRAPQHKPNDSTRIGTGQSSCRGRVRCQSPFIAGERRRCEPGSNSVIVTASLTRCEGHVLRLGGVLRTRKIFVGCPAIRPIRDQSPGIRNPRLETVGNRLYPLHDQISLRCFAAEANFTDRSRTKTGLNTAPGFLRVSQSFPRTPPSFPRRREPTEKQSTPFTPFREAKGAREPKRPQTDSGGCPQSPPRTPIRGREPTAPITANHQILRNQRFRQLPEISLTPAKE